MATAENVNMENQNENKETSAEMDTNENEDVESKPQNDCTDGKRFRHVKNAINRTVDKCLSAGRFSLFAKNHPSVAKENLKALKYIHKQSQDKLKDAIQLEFETMFQEERLAEFLNELDQLTEDDPSESAKPDGWRPSGDPSADIRHHYVPIKLKQKERLEKLLETFNDDNQRLMKVVSQRRQKVLDSQQEIHSKVSKLKQTTEDLPMEKINRFMANCPHQHHKSGLFTT